MAASEPAEPPEGWEVVAQEQQDGVRWMVRRLGRRPPAAWGLTSRRSAVRWAWRLAGPGARLAAAPAHDDDRSAELPSGKAWWALKD